MTKQNSLWKFVNDLIYQHFDMVTVKYNLMSPEEVQSMKKLATAIAREVRRRDARKK